MRKIRIHLTQEEETALNIITRKTKTECWFSLSKDREGFDCVRDLERGYKITLRFACQLLCEAVDWMQKEDWKNLGVRQIDVDTFYNLCRNRLGIEC